MDKVGIAQLILNKEATEKKEFSKYKGVKIFSLDEKTGKPDYHGNTMIVWASDLVALLAGARDVPVYLGVPYEANGVKKKA